MKGTNYIVLARDYARFYSSQPAQMWNARYSVLKTFSLLKEYDSLNKEDKKRVLNKDFDSCDDMIFYCMFKCGRELLPKRHIKNHIL